MSDEKESEQKETLEEQIQKGWNDFVNGIKSGFEDFQKSMEDEAIKNKELWEQNKEKVNNFFDDIKQRWDKKVNEWKTDIEKRGLESKEQWEVHKKKINEDIKNWQEKARSDWEHGFKFFRKGFLKIYLWTLLLILPIIIIVIVILFIVNNLIG
ncbi:MAG: hypothetical protein ACFFEO_15450 [Candidatus Thorarchaeota archaeon]